MAKEKPQLSVRITNQFRRGQAMVYDLSCDEVRLTLEFSARENGDGLGEWNIEAHARAMPDQATIDEPGVTRVDALRAVARSWAARQGRHGFPSLDWEAVALALLAVRAI